MVVSDMFKEYLASFLMLYLGTAPGYYGRSVSIQNRIDQDCVDLDETVIKTIKETAFYGQEAARHHFAGSGRGQDCVDLLFKPLLKLSQKRPSVAKSPPGSILQVLAEAQILSTSF